HDVGPIPDLLLVEPRRIAAAAFRPAPSTVPHPPRYQRPPRTRRRYRLRSLSHPRARPVGEHGNFVGVRNRLYGRADSKKNRAGDGATLQDSRHAVGSSHWNTDLPLLDVRPAATDL